MALLLLLGPSGLSVVQTECVCRLVYDFSQKEPKKEALSTELMNRSLFCYSIRSKQICWKIFHLGSVNDKPFFFRLLLVQHCQDGPAEFFAHFSDDLCGCA